MISRPNRIGIGAMRSLGNRIGGGFFSPANLLVPGATLAASWEIWDLTTLFQDRAGTTPVTAAGQPVGQIKDRIGTNHLTATSDAARGTYQIGADGKPYVQFSGSQVYATPSLTKVVTCAAVFAAVRKDSDATIGNIMDSGNPTAGYFRLRAPGGVATPWYNMSSTGPTFTRTASVTTIAAPSSNVVSGFIDLTAPLVLIRTNGGAQSGQSISDMGGGTFSTAPTYVGAQAGASDFFNGRLYGLSVRYAAAQISDANRNAMEAGYQARLGS